MKDNIFYKVVLRVIIYILLCFNIGHVNANAEACEYLKRNINTNNSIASRNSISTDFQSSALSINALIKSGCSINDLLPTYSYLASYNQEMNTEYLSLYMLVKYRLGRDISTEIDELAIRQNADGGFGAFVGYQSTVFDTAQALLALGVTNHLSSINSSSLTYLAINQKSDGGWSVNDQSSPSIEASSLVLHALRYFSVHFDLTKEINKAKQYLLKNKKEQHWGSEYVTGLALQALLPLSLDTALTRDSLDWLKKQQYPNGSWNDDVFITALIAQVLASSSTNPLPPEPSSMLVSGRILDADTSKPLGNVKIYIDDSTLHQATTSQDGTFSFTFKNIGSYELHYRVDGYNYVSQRLEVHRLEPVKLGDISLEKNSTSSSLIVVEGVVNDSHNNQPLNGASIRFTGINGTYSVQSDGKGEYQLIIDKRGEYNFAVEKEGYHSLAGTASVAIGQHILFSPNLTPNTQSEINTPSQLSTKVIDSRSGEGIANAMLKLTNNKGSFSAISDINGNVIINNISAGQYQLVVSNQKYQTKRADIVIPGKSHIELSVIKLDAILLSSQLSGIVVDKETNQPLSNVIVNIAELNQQLRTDDQGKFLFTGITQLEFEFSLTAPGYQSQTAKVQWQTHQHSEVLISLEPKIHNQQGIGLLSLASAAPSYGANDKAILNAAFYNNSEQAVTLQMVAEIQGPNGYFLRQPISHSEIEGDMSDTVLTLPAGETYYVVDFEWMTGVLPPGRYHILLQAYDMESLQLKAELSTPVTIDDVANIQALHAKVWPPFTNVKAVERTSVSADVTHNSNKAHSVMLRYSLSTPSGSVIIDGEQTILLQPSQPTFTISLATMEYNFEESGDYPFTIEVIQGVQPERTFNTYVSVAPLIHVEPTLSITPNAVTPETDKNIRVQITLTGRGQ